MILVLIIASAEPARPAVLDQTLQRFAALGAAVTIVGDAGVAVPDGAARVVPLPPGGSTGRMTPGERLWQRARRHSITRRAAARADVIIALDAPAVHVAWQLALRHRGASVVFGLIPGLRQVEARAARPGRRSLRRLLTWGPSPELVRQAAGQAAVRYRTAAVRRIKGALGAATGTRVHRTGLGRAVWRLTVRHAPLPARVRIPLARRVAASLTRAGFPDQAATTLTTTAGRLSRPGQRARMLAGAAGTDLRAGTIPRYLPAAATAVLATADAALRAEDRPAAATAADRALGLLFHRAVHFDSVTSPATADPAAFVRPWLTSATGQALAVQRGRAARPVPGPKVLFLYETNANFLGPIRERFTADPGREVRSLDLDTVDELGPVLRDRARRIEGLLGRSADLERMLERVLRPHLDWADVVFMDWCKAGAALLTRIDPGTTRVMIRLHSQEVFTDWPYLVDWSRVDDLIFVSDHLRDYTRAAVPSVTAPGGPRLSVLPNAMDLRPYARPKPADARFTVGLVGFSAIAKDPRWAIEVLRRLRRQDPRYRLLLIGGDVRGRVSAAAGRYDRAYRRDLAELEPAGAVRRYGPTDDVPAALTGVGTILSSSVRESFHCGLFEGAASGAVPVVRDWPFFPGAALRMFPADWVVTSPDQAADRILAVTGSEPTWRAAGAAAAAEVLDRWDWPVTAAAYDEAIGGELNTSV